MQALPAERPRSLHAGGRQATITHMRRTMIALLLFAGCEGVDLEQDAPAPKTDAECMKAGGCPRVAAPSAGGFWWCEITSDTQRGWAALALANAHPDDGRPPQDRPSVCE